MSAVQRMSPNERVEVSSSEYIVRVEGVMGGRPVIRGTRITVRSVLGRLAGGDRIEDLTQDYPDVPREAFEAVVADEARHLRRDV